MSCALIVIAHGSRIEAANLEFTAMLQTIDYAALGYGSIAGAFLEAASPSLSQAVARIDGRQGVTDIDVYPLFFNKGRHVDRDLPALVEGLTAEHPNVGFRLLPYFGSFSSLGAAIAQHISASRP